jgi:hypothetical protein
MQKLQKYTFILSTSAPYADFHPKDNLYMWGIMEMGIAESPSSLIPTNWPPLLLITTRPKLVRRF